jgi:short subunit dehydrogenase-like uncharacterized protein
MSTSRPYHLIIFGATGFTGQHATLYLAKYLLTHHKQQTFQFAIAGRSESKLLALRATIRARLSYEFKIPLGEKDLFNVIVADIDDTASIQSMTSQCELILTAAGPFSQYGEQLVRSCINTRTHYADITGEPLYIEKMMLQYNSSALANGVLIIHAVGFDSIPADCGYLYTLRQAKQLYGENSVVNNIDCLMHFNVDKKVGYVGNVGTWYSLVHGLTNVNQLNSTRKELRLAQESGNTKILRSGPPSKHGLFYYDARVNYWAVKFPGADSSIVRNSQYYYARHNQGESHKFQPHYSAYFTLGSIFTLLRFLVIGVLLKLFLLFKAMKPLLLAYPTLFSLGLFSLKGPSPQQIAGANFTLQMFAYGWKNKAERSTQPPSLLVHSSVSGADPGYAATATMMIQAALTILLDREKMPAGGVLTAGPAFQHTKLISRLQEEGVTFQDNTNSTSPSSRP